MDYEVKYKEALEVAKNLYKVSNTEDIINPLKNMFSEIREMEENRIRKELIAFLKNASEGHLDISTPYKTFGKWLAWLERRVDDIMPMWGCVDLGLPSGTLWAAMNVGATSKTDFGLFFAWGDTQGYTASQVGIGSDQKAFSWYDYVYGTDSNLTKYNSTDILTTLEPTDDAAYALSNGQYAMPTKVQFEELIENTNSKWDDERKGYVFASKINGSELFFPAAGRCLDSCVLGVGSFGSYWASSLNLGLNHYAWNLFFGSGRKELISSSRCCGASVRGVLLQN